MKIMLAVITGGIIGFAVGYFGKGAGVCYLTNEPVVSTITGAMLGVMMAILR